jgi:SAM-dependent methyltransferase
MSTWRSLGLGLFNHAIGLNIRIVARLAASSGNQASRVLDLGCWDGATLSKYLPEGAQTFGVELNHDSSVKAHHRGVRIIRADLDRRLPFRDEMFDLVTSHQVIEHVGDTDNFVSEAFRVLKKGGCAVISTENLASWHNAVALMLGWQPFSLTNVTRKRSGLGNPLANLRVEEPRGGGWQHMRVFSYRGLLELFEAHGFVSVRIFGAGYYPLPASFGKIDPRHAAFITLKGTRS